MKVVILNGSPKGEYSITLQYVRFLVRLYSGHEFRILHVSQKIKKLEKNLDFFHETIKELEDAGFHLKQIENP